MLTYAQLKTEAYIDDDYEPMCEKCAGEKHGVLFISKMEARLVESGTDSGNGSVRPVIGYEMGEFENREVERMAEDRREHDEDPDFDEDEYVEGLIGTPVIQCSGTCGRWYTGGGEPWQEWDGDPEKKPEYVRTVADSQWTM